MYFKLAAVFTVVSVGGPLGMYYLTPDPDALFQRFSPELQKRNLENRDRRMAEYEDFRTKMIEYSKSDKPIWVAAEEAREKARADIVARTRQEQRDRADQQEAMKKEMAAGR
jgi:hypothetical protein